MKRTGIKRQFLTISLMLISGINIGYAQQKLKTITATSEKVHIRDGNHVKMDWRLEPGANPDIYYVNQPSQKSVIIFKTDQDELSIQTKPGKKYDFVVLLNGKDSCRIQIASILPPDVAHFKTKASYPIRVPFQIISSKIFFDGKVNDKSVQIQFDLGAGTSVVNKKSSGKIGLAFSSHKMVSNTQGLNKERTSLGNKMNISGLQWSDIPLTEVGNMDDFEDIIIGNSFFRDKIIGINYDKREFTVYENLPKEVKGYTKMPVYYVQHRPFFNVDIVHQSKKYNAWFLFDTGRDGSMLIGNDFTGMENNWEELQPLTTVNGRKIVRLDALIAGVEFKDIVTNASDPAISNAKASLFGNQILKHFNVILDNKTGLLYLKPNSLSNEPYFNYDSYLKQISSK
ncbi:retropepsin-like aspartic protease [Terrimonas rubra]|uniref:Retropepsin-like aspartic protease n=1 Tax=Terrimonas rubra TaxID=1035890 RepID=A0ABW6A2I4_9BACT